MTDIIAHFTSTQKKEKNDFFKSLKKYFKEIEE